MDLSRLGWDQPLTCDLAERSQLGLQYVFPPLHPTELDQEAVTFAAGGASNPFAQARQVTLDRLQLSFDCVAIDFVGRHRFVSEDSAALRCYLGDAADDKNPPCDGLPLVNLDHPRPDRRNQRRMTGQHTEIPLGARHHHHLDHFREQQTLGGDQIELYALRHRIRRSSGRLGRHLLRLGDGFFDLAYHIKGALGQVVVITGDDSLEAFDRVFEIDQGTGGAGENFGDKERL